MAIIYGTRNTLNTNSLQKVRDVQKVMTAVAPVQAPFSQFLMVNDYTQEATAGPRSKFEWFEDSFYPYSTTLSAQMSGGAPTATVLVTDATLGNFDLVYFEATKEYGRVTSGEFTNNVTFTKVGAGNFTTCANASIVSILTSVNQDNYSTPTAKSTDANNKFGLCSILLNSVKVSYRQMNSDIYTGDDFKRQIAKRMQEVKLEIERLFIKSGTAYDDTTADITYTAGLLGSITSNISLFNTTVTESSLDDFLEKVMQKGSPERVLFVGSTYLSGMNKFLKDAFKYNIDNQEAIEMYGGIGKKGQKPRIMTYNSLKGPVSVIWNPVMDTVNLANAAFCIDPKLVKMRYFKNGGSAGAFKYEENVQLPGQGNRTDQIKCDIGLMLENENLHGLHLPA